MTALGAPPAAGPAGEGQGIAGRLADLGLVAGIVAIVALMIVPLPAPLIDLLVGINICLGILLLLATLYVREPLDFSSFPSVLLVSTLFRLALSIATTRMILLDGHAGHIIDAFGRMVAGGNLVVGLVVFLIITIVQFIVIAKGAERVAEVAARFSLDAMPGKQLSIDSDLRSGLIDKDEARRKRRMLEQESKLHGSLDGAMKFVKGDAIASIVIVLVNLLGGLAIGIWQKDMAFGAAVEKYSILSIGDGLVSQIPALLSAMAAGLLVTRAGGEGDSNLGATIQRQLGQNPRVLIFGGTIALLMAAVPGFPVAVFLGLGAAGLTVGLALHHRTAPRMLQLLGPLGAPFARYARQRRPLPERLLAAAPEPRVPRALALELELSGADRAGAGELQRLRTALDTVLAALQARSGLPLPELEIAVGHGQATSRWRLLVHEVPVAGSPLDRVGDWPEQLAATTQERLSRRLQQLIGVQETTTLLNRAGLHYPEAVKEAVRAVPTAKIADVLRRLVEEDVPISTMRDVLEAIAEAGQHQREPAGIAELVRVSLRRHILARIVREDRLHLAVVSPALEDRLRAAARGGGEVPAVTPEDRAALVAAVAAVRDAGADGLLTAFELRRGVRKLIDDVHADLPVLSFNELVADVELRIVGQVDLPAPALAPPRPAAEPEVAA
jgi:type III secretion protein V